MPFMKPVVEKMNVYEAETSVGTEVVDAGLVDPTNPRESVLAYVEGDTIEDITFREGVYVAYTTAPGYMDRTQFSAFASEKEAWDYLVEYFPSAFIWDVEDADDGGSTASALLPSPIAAEAISGSVQTVCGARLERDESFVYVAPQVSSDDLRKELYNLGFETSV